MPAENATTANSATDTVPKALLEYLSEQQERARELQSLLEMLDEAIDSDIVGIGARMAHEINEALDVVNLPGGCP